MADPANTVEVEIWKDVPGQTEYEVSSLGRVRRKAKLLKPWKHHAGYDYIQFPGKNGAPRDRWSMHRLVCEAFNGPAPAPGLVAAHSDGDARNNAASNLRWATYAENNADARAHGTAFNIAGYAASLPAHDQPNSKLSSTDYDTIRALRDAGVSREEISKQYGISLTHVSRIAGICRVTHSSPTW